MKRAAVIYGTVALAAVAVVGLAYWRLRASMKGTPYEGTGILGVLGFATNAASAGVLQRTGEAIGAATFRVFNPESDIPDVHYRVVFPDGAAHAIHAADIDKSGYFRYAGVRYRLVIDGDTKRAQAA